MDRHPDVWTDGPAPGHLDGGGGQGGLIRFYHEIAGVGLVFPFAEAGPPSTPPSKGGTPPVPPPHRWPQKLPPPGGPPPLSE
jgi:hypothetical protein